MAQSGTTNVAVTSWDTLRFTWEVTGQSVENNTTTIKWQMFLVATSSGAIISAAAKDWKATIAGKSYSGTNTVGISNNTTKTLASGTQTITHAEDGTATFNYSFSQEFAIYFSGSYIGTKSGSGSGTLPTIARKSTLSAGNGTLGTAQPLTPVRSSASFTHTLTYKCGSASGTIATKSSSTSISWTPPLSLASQNTTGTTVSITITLTTYSGNTSLGSTTKTITCAIPASVKPSCTLTLEDTTGFDDIYGSPVQGLSKIKITANPALAYGSPIASYTLTAEGAKYTTQTATTAALKTAGNSPVTATVTDKRGRSGSVSYTMRVLAYALPAISSLAVRRCDADGTENDQGEYIKATFSAKVTALNNKNTAAYVLRYKKSTAASYTSVTLSAYANTYTVNGGTYIFAADGSSSYDVDLTVTDRHGKGTRSSSASTAFTLINWGADGTSMAIGKVAEKPGTFEVGLPTLFHGPVTMTTDAKHTLTLTADFVPYRGRDANRPWYRKNAAGVVEISGAVSPASSSNAVGSNTNVAIGTLPEGYRPAQGFYQLQQGSGTDVWLASVAPDGTVAATRHRSGADYSTPVGGVDSGDWLIFHLLFIADQ